MRIPYDSLNLFKSKSKLVSKIIGLPRADALEFLAKLSGYATYFEVRKSCYGQGQVPTLQDVANGLLKLHPAFTVPQAVATAESLALHAPVPLVQFESAGEIHMEDFITQTALESAHSSEINRELMRILRKNAWMVQNKDWENTVPNILDCCYLLAGITPAQAKRLLVEVEPLYKQYPGCPYINTVVVTALIILGKPALNTAMFAQHKRICKELIERIHTFSRVPFALMEMASMVMRPLVALYMQEGRFYERFIMLGRLDLIAEKMRSEDWELEQYWHGDVRRLMGHSLACMGDLNTALKVLERTPVEFRKGPAEAIVHAIVLAQLGGPDKVIHMHIEDVLGSDDGDKWVTELGLLGRTPPVRHVSDDFVWIGYSHHSNDSFDLNRFPAARDHFEQVAAAIHS